MPSYHSPLNRSFSGNRPFIFDLKGVINQDITRNEITSTVSHLLHIFANRPIR